MPFRISIRKVKTLVWTLCIVALGADGLSFWKVYEKIKVNREYEPRSATVLTEILHRDTTDDQVAMVTGYDSQRQTAIWTTLVDGSVRKGPEVEAKPETEAPKKKIIEPMDQVLEVSLIVYNSDPIARFAAVKYKPTARVAPSGKSRRLHLTEGTPLHPPYDADPYFGELLRIEPQQVVFSWGGAEVTVTPGLGRDGTGPTQEDFFVADVDDPTAGLEEWPEATTEVEPGVFLLGSAPIARIRADPKETILKSIRVRPIPSSGGGQRTVLEFVSVEDSSLAADIGVQSGDKLISVNGIPMPSLIAAINWYEANSDLPSYTIVYERYGKQHSTTIYPPE